MEKKEINLEEIYQRLRPKHSSHKELAISLAKEACKQALELASENAEIDVIETTDDSSGFIHEVNKQSILNTINQIK